MSEQQPAPAESANQDILFKVGDTVVMSLGVDGMRYMGALIKDSTEAYIAFNRLMAMSQGAVECETIKNLRAQLMLQTVEHLKIMTDDQRAEVLAPYNQVAE